MTEHSAGSPTGAWSYRPGSWFGVFGAATTLLLPASEKARVGALWSLVDDGAGFDEVLDALIQTGLGKLPGFVLVGQGEGPTKILVRGASVVVSATAGGEDVEIHGSGASTWVERTLDDVTALSVTVDGGDPASLDLPIHGGLVRVGRVDHPPYAVATVVPAEPAAEPAAVVADVPALLDQAEGDELAVDEPIDEVAEVAEPVEEIGEEIGEVPAPTVEPYEPAASEDVPEVPAEAPAPPTTFVDDPWAPKPPTAEPVVDVLAEPSPLDEEADTNNMGAPPPPPAYPPVPVPPSPPAWPGSTPPPSPPPPPPYSPPGLPPEGPPTGDFPADDLMDAPTMAPPGIPPVTDPPAAPDLAPDLESDHDGMTQVGVDPSEFSRPQPGIPGQPMASGIGRSVAKLMISSGEVVEVDRVVLVGRAPEARRFTSTDQPRLVTVPSPLHEISSTHLEVRPGSGADHGSAVVTDMGSTNGTVLVQPGLAPEELKPGIAVQLIPGATINLGDGVTIQVTHP